MDADVGVLPAEQLDAVHKGGQQEDPADPIFGHPASHDDAHEGEREGQDQERRTADAREDVARKDAARADQQQHDRRTPAHHA